MCGMCVDVCDKGHLIHKAASRDWRRMREGMDKERDG